MQNYLPKESQHGTQDAEVSEQVHEQTDGAIWRQIDATLVSSPAISQT